MTSTSFLNPYLYIVVRLISHLILSIMKNRNLNYLDNWLLIQKENDGDLLFLFSRRYSNITVKIIYECHFQQNCNLSHVKFHDETLESQMDWLDWLALFKNVLTESPTFRSCQFKLLTTRKKNNFFGQWPQRNRWTMLLRTPPPIPPIRFYHQNHHHIRLFVYTRYLLPYDHPITPNHHPINHHPNHLNHHHLWCWDYPLELKLSFKWSIFEGKLKSVCRVFWFFLVADTQVHTLPCWLVLLSVCPKYF